MSGVNYVEQADALLDDVKLSDLSIDVQSYAATYVAKRDEGDTRAATAWARALVRRAAREGHSAKVERSAAELKAEIDRRNEDREEGDQIKPDGRSKAAMQAALDADDEDGGA